MFDPVKPKDWGGGRGGIHEALGLGYLFWGKELAFKFIIILIKKFYLY